MRTASALPLLLLVLASCAWADSASPTTVSAPLSPRHQVKESDYLPTLQVAESQSRIQVRTGMIRENHPAVRLQPRQRAQVSPVPSAGDTLLLAIVIPDDAAEHQYHFELLDGSASLHRRSGGTRGFGRRTFFIPMPSLPDRDASSPLTLVNRASEDLFVTELTVLKDFDGYLAGDDPHDLFTLSLLMNDPESTPSLDVITSLPSAPGVQKAMAREIYFAAHKEERLREEAFLNWKQCEQHGLKFLPLVCSWWAGTPHEVKQRLEFQQICWSDTDTYDEGPALREMLGDRWDLRYGWTIPNKWSSTPWQTMNSPELNALRHRRLRKTVDILEKTIGDHILAYVTENEPAYWAWENSDEKYPVKRKNLWADFNPQTVDAARKAGVELNPADGLDIIERTWFHHNASQYQQDTVNVIRDAGASGTVYSHALLDFNHFPFDNIERCRPYADIARVENARVGVEMVFGTDMDALWRIREWGRWANVNREEWDGYHLGYHVATLRACYFQGADLFNSYNWQSMGREGDPVVYFTTFLEDLSKRNGEVTIGERAGSDEWHPVTDWHAGVATDEACPWANAIQLNLRARSGAAPLRVRLRAGTNGPVVADRLLAWPEVNPQGPTVVRFGDYTHLSQTQDHELYLSATPGGWEYQGSFWGPDYRLFLDMKEERKRALYTMNRSAQVTTAGLELKVE